MINLNFPVIEILDKNAFLCNNINYIIDLPKCEYVGKNAFMNSRFEGILNLPKCEKICSEAFLNSYFSIIIIGADAFLEKFCIGAHSAEFINKYRANNRRAGMYIWDGEDWIYKK